MGLRTYDGSGALGEPKVCVFSAPNWGRVPQSPIVGLAQEPTVEEKKITKSKVILSITRDLAGYTRGLVGKKSQVIPGARYIVGYIRGYGHLLAVWDLFVCRGLKCRCPGIAKVPG